MDIYSYIIRDHRRLAGLMDDLMSIRVPAVRQPLFRQIQTELSAHSDAEERTFYAAVENATQTQVMNDRLELSEHEHHEIKALMHVLSRLSVGSGEWMEKFGELKFAIEHHVAREEGEIFPQAKAVLTPLDAHRLALQMDALKQQILAGHDDTTTIYL
ncbi:MAG: hemerythrin domain-containing protein [Asticcacaulis sp.]|uniref:hemerythrin domain-containing protein n=1 Tax=Asticcacaulis sp. TaxID=1872648 RepID=UPI0039E2FC8D